MVYKGATIIGVLSKSPTACKEDELAATYTRVSSYLQFIDDAINRAINDRSNEGIRAHEY